MGIIIPTDFRIFQRGWYTTNQIIMISLHFSPMTGTPGPPFHATIHCNPRFFHGVGWRFSAFLTQTSTTGIVKVTNFPPGEFHLLWISYGLIWFSMILWGCWFFFSSSSYGSMILFPFSPSFRPFRSFFWLKPASPPTKSPLYPWLWRANEFGFG